MEKEKLRDKILDAAEKVIRAKGLPDVTTEDIAKEAMISKGCVFYHFASKKDVLLGIVSRYERILDDMRDQIYMELPDQPSKKLKSIFLALVAHPNQMNGNIIAMLADKEIRLSINKLKAKLHREVVSDAADHKQAVLVMIVFDGLWLSEIFEEKIYTRKLAAEIVGDLLESLNIVFKEESDLKRVVRSLKR
jgi:Transcriptional regulator